MDAVVDEGPRQPVALAEGEEEQLEVGAAPFDEREVRHPMPGELRLAERAAEEVGLERAADVLDRPDGRGDRDAVAPGHVAARERARAVDDDPGPRLTTNSGIDGDVHRTLDRSQELPERHGTRMAQHGPVPRREHRRQPPSPPTERLRCPTA